VLLNCEDKVLGPLTTDHAPVPTDGVFPDKVAVPVLQIDWVEPLVAAVGVPDTVMVASAVVGAHGEVPLIVQRTT
jgi:hypothetical protein